MSHKLLGWSVKNFCRIEVMTVAVNGKSVEVAGRNASGKTSGVSAIWAGLGGPTVTKEMGITKPVKNGAETAEICLDLDDLLVRREINTDGSTKKLMIAMKDGTEIKATQSLLDTFRGKLFDISAFGRMDAKKQMDLILPVVGLKLDLAAHTAAREAVFKQRTDVNRDAKSLKAQVEAIAAEEVPEQEVSIADIAAEQQAAQEKIDAGNELRQELQNKVAERSMCNERIAAANENIGGLEVQIAELQKKLAVEKEKLAGLEQDLAAINQEGKLIQERVKALPADPDMSGFTQRIADVEKINVRIRKQQERQRLARALSVKEQESSELTAKLEQMDGERLAAIKAANWPIEGMGVDDSGITYNGVPTSQASGGENLLMGYAVAKALSPKFNVLRLSRPDDLDDGNKTLLYEMAERDGYVIVAEQVSHGEGSGLEIVDGTLNGGTTAGLEKLAEIAKPKRARKGATAAEQSCNDVPVEM